MLGGLPEETCLALVKSCDALIVLIDQYYGTQSKLDQGISITHAELRVAQKLGLTIIPVVRKQTWHEHAIWRLNSNQQVLYAHVKEPELFRMLDEILLNYNCHVFDTLTGEEAISKIAFALESVLSEGATGTVQHVTLAAEADTGNAAKPTSAFGEVIHFAESQLLKAEELNKLYGAIVEIANKRGMQLIPSVVWTNGQKLESTQLNLLLNDVNNIYTHCGLTLPVWSFGQFKAGMVLRASYLNEISNNLEALN
ncbi:MAG: DUF4062 domain-containing protein [Sulfuriferula sp.]